MHGLRRFVSAASLVVLVTPLMAQVAVPTPAPLPLVVQPAPAPSTKLEGFQPDAGAVVTLGYEELGTIARGRVSMDVRDLRDTKGNTAAGVTVFVTETSSRLERSFVDADEIPGVLKGLDALLAVTANPTPLKKFEVRFTTRSSLAFVAYSNAAGTIDYAIQAGRPWPATLLNIDGADMIRMRGLFELALQKLVR